MAKELFFFMKVFVVDDNEDTTKTLSQVLDHMGLESEITNDPMVALKKIRRNHFDVILLDMDIQVVKGYSVLEMLAAADILKEQNVFAYSSTNLSDIELKNLLRRDGVNGFMKKPINLQKIVNLIYS